MSFCLSTDLKNHAPTTITVVMFKKLLHSGERPLYTSSNYNKATILLQAYKA